MAEIDAQHPTPARAEAHGETIVLLKNDQRYAFRCAPGDETAMIEQWRQLAADPEHEMTWFDAAVLTRQLGERMSQRLSVMRRE